MNIQKEYEKCKNNKCVKCKKDITMEDNYYCKICDCEITKWQHENNDDICTFCQEELDEDNK